ncbi:hypothetical protein ACIQRW_09215 [Streptomyces sp. NPDC091287]|uniref:hypothetical protein n=1 Tax=Streptomyces sp. NPDC091287 TaxID=3365988 RepID=UPI00382CC55B
MEELADDPRPEECVEVAFGPMRPSKNPDLFVIPEPLRITPADLARLRVETELAMGEIRAEVLHAELAWRMALGRWYVKGKAAVDSREPDVALLARILDGLRKQDVASV